jgi:hypothetical protein
MKAKTETIARALEGLTPEGFTKKSLVERYTEAKIVMYAVRVGAPDPKFGNMLLKQFGGANGELAATMQYSVQGMNREDPARKDLLMDIGTDEPSHLEVIGSLARLHLSVGALLSSAPTKATERHLRELHQPCRPAALLKLARQHRLHAAFAPRLPALQVFLERGPGQAREIGHRDRLNYSASGKTEWVEFEESGDHTGRCLRESEL